LLYAIPNGGKRNIGVARKLKAEGVKKGIPDLHLPVARGRYNSLYIELKTQKGRLTADQAEVIALLEEENNKVVVAYGHEQAEKAIVKYLTLNK